MTNRICFGKTALITMAFCMLLSCQSRDDSPGWTFVSMPDFINVDCDYPQPGWEDALSYILGSVKKENPDFLIVGGDMVMGEWDAPDWNDKDSIDKYSNRYYPAWIKRMNDHGLKFYTAIGDHEIGDNDWPTEKRLEAVKIYKEAFARHFKMPENGPSSMKGTAFWWRHKNVLFISMDLFEEGKSRNGLIKIGVTGEQLSWFRKILSENADADHRIVVGHAPVLGPVRKWSSSALMVNGGRESEFWQTMKEYRVDAYLCGEVHAITCTERDGIMQIAHGGLIGYNTRTNYLVAHVSKSKIDIEIKEIGMLPAGDHLWQAQTNRPLENVTISQADKAKGFVPVGTLTIDKNKGKQFVNRAGYFLREYETSDETAVPVFRSNNPKGLPTELPRITLSGPTRNKISNELIEITIDEKNGSVDIFDQVNKRFIVRNSTIGFSLRPYMDLNDLGRIAVETELPDTSFSSQGADNFIRTSSRLKTAFPGGKSISLVSRIEDQGELEVQFTLYPDSTFIDLGMAFKNTGKAPVRLKTADLLHGILLPGLDHKKMITLDGNSGGGKTDVGHSGKTVTENNLLCYFPGSKKQHSLVAGGLTYEDYRKYVSVSNDSLRLFADDAVGKRVDPGSVYLSADRFYLSSFIGNPFEALEAYAITTKKARDIGMIYYPFPSVCMWFLAVTHFGADASSENSSVGAVMEMNRIRESGFLKYSPVAVRLVPDNYEQNNEQGWWDDEHWQQYGRTERCAVDHHYKAPYETTKKWAGRITELGGIPITYFQPGIRSEDYAATFPGHMLYNQKQKFIRENKRVVSDPHTLMGIAGIPDLLDPNDWIDGYGKLYAESYDYTDPGFLDHWKNVNLNLKEGGVSGVFYDYPDRAYPMRGGLEDRYSTALKAYCTIFRIPHEVLGPGAFLQERLGIGSDATLPYVASVRTEGDTNVINTSILNKTAYRWYKNRTLTNYDMDGKAIIEAGHGHERYQISPLQRKSILTLSYAVSGRLLLTESFSKFSEEVIFELSRVFPFHSTTLSARPLHAFTGGMPVLDFPISGEWHQVVLYNDSGNARDFAIQISGNTAIGALGLDAARSYYAYDFWNDKFYGNMEGDGKLVQTVDAGEARMLSIHAVESHPQWISTNRHILQGYVDLVKKPVWNPQAYTLSGTSSVIAHEPYRITIALNGYEPLKVACNMAKARIMPRKNNPGLADLVMETDVNTDVSWEILFTGTSKDPDK
jgi:hypothetical protein